VPSADHKARQLVGALAREWGAHHALVPENGYEEVIKEVTCDHMNSLYI
jgi:hypothetical protein